MNTIYSKIMNIEVAAEYVKTQKELSKKIVVTNGCFDLLHAGHINYLMQAKQYGDILIVALNSDSSVKQLKGSNRPIILQDDRALTLASLQFVDCVIIFDSPRATAVFEKIPPDVYVKGGDYSIENLDRSEYNALLKSSCEFVFIPLSESKSTTNIIQTIINRHS